MAIATKKINFVLANPLLIPFKTPHFGLASIAAYIREKNTDINISIVEGADIVAKIIAKKPDVVGFTSDTLNYQNTVAVARELKAKVNIPILIGGVHITAMPESLDPVFQLGIVGEGEVTTNQLLRIFKNEHQFSADRLASIPGIVYFADGELKKTEKRALIPDIDILPYPARDLTPMEEIYLKDQLNLFGVKRMATIMTSRGCPYRCVFCGSPVHWGSVRFHSAEYVVGEIEFLIKKYNIDGIMFWDDLFIAPLARLQKMAKLIKEKGIDKKITFFGFARANLMTEEIFTSLREMNVKRLIFGLESCSEKILDYLKRSSVKVADNERAVDLCRKYGVTSSSGYICGTPGETVEDLQKTYDFMKKHPLDNSQIYILTPYPGTEIWRNAEKEGLVSPKMNFQDLFVQLPSPSLLDFFKKNKPDILAGRIFLNSAQKDNAEYTELIFKMMKLAFWQNIKFYVLTIFKEPALLWRIINIKCKQLFHAHS